MLRCCCCHYADAFAFIRRHSPRYVAAVSSPTRCCRFTPIAFHAHERSAPRHIDARLILSVLIACARWFARARARRSHGALCASFAATLFDAAIFHYFAAFADAADAAAYFMPRYCRQFDAAAATMLLAAMPVARYDVADAADCCHALIRR